MSFYPLNKKIGIIGGGQLGKMMILEAKKFGCHIVILDPTKNCPASSVCDEHIVANFSDKEAIYLLAKKCDVITYEFEHIDYSCLIELEKLGHKIYPSPSSLKIIQNKFTQKTVLKENNINVPDFYLVKTIEDIKNVIEKFSYPIVLKCCTGGYDGKGNYVIKCEEDIEKAFNTLNPTLNIPLMVEKFVPFKMEVSVLACGGLNKDIKVYPVANNIHIDNILYKTLVPANISKESKNKAITMAYNIINIFNGIGMFCVEFFVTENDDILVNEIAPRPHNSGHYTIEGCITSQFENHIRAILGLPLGNTNLLKPSVMINLLGEDGYKGDAILEGLEDALNIENVFVHVYGKKQTVPKRKMGHLTCIMEDLKKAEENATKAYNKLKFICE
nr:5-(carboxyamino)imidazole ribonucleotide synthase [uncultured Tyzzerella sp.]